MTILNNMNWRCCFFLSLDSFSNKHNHKKQVELVLGLKLTSYPGMDEEGRGEEEAGPSSEAPFARRPPRKGGLAIYGCLTMKYLVLFLFLLYFYL